MDLLRALWTRPGWGEFRCIKNGEITRRWFRTDSHDWNDYVMNQAINGWDVYYGVLPRMEDGEGTAGFVETWTDVLWADIDIKTVGSRMAAFLALTKASLPEPHFVVDSGNGFHAYWRVVRTDWDLAEEAMRGIAREAQGDHVYDRARILRVPGTWNYKDPGNPKPVRLLRFDQVRGPYRIDSFPTPPSTPTFTPNDSWAEGYGEMPSWLEDLIRDGVPKGVRSETSYKVVCHLLRLGWGGSQIEDIFIANPQGIGAKYAEKGKDGPRWLRTTIKSAQSR